VAAERGGATFDLVAAGFSWEIAAFCGCAKVGGLRYVCEYLTIWELGHGDEFLGSQDSPVPLCLRRLELGSAMSAEVRDPRARCRERFSRRRADRP